MYHKLISLFSNGCIAYVCVYNILTYNMNVRVNIPRHEVRECYLVCPQIGGDDAGGLGSGRRPAVDPISTASQATVGGNDQPRRVLRQRL